jgi:hypothetical protein
MGPRAATSSRRVSQWWRALPATPQCLIGVLLDTLGVGDLAGFGVVFQQQLRC